MKNMKKRVLYAIGFLFLAVAAVGLALPVMPTVPFVLVAAACFAASSPKHYARLRDNPYFGEYVRGYSEGRGISPRARNRALALLWVSLAGSAVLSAVFLHLLFMPFILAAVGIGVTIHLVKMTAR